MLFIIFILLNCKKYNFTAKRSKPIAEGIELAGNLLSVLGLDEPIKNIIDVIKLPITITSEIIQDEIRGYIENLRLKSKKDRNYKNFIVSVSDGNSKDALEILKESKDKDIYFDESVREDKKIYLINLAIEKDMQKVVDAMIEKGALLSVQDDDGATPLMLAIKLGREQIFSKILENLDETIINVKDINNYNALHWAILSSKSDIFVRPLLKKGARIVLSPQNKLNELHFASLVGNYSAVVEIIDNYKSSKEVILNVGKGNSSVKKEIFQPTNEYRQTAFHFAAISGSQEIYRYLSNEISPKKEEVFLPVDIKGATPLHYLALSNALKIIRDKLVGDNKFFKGLSISLDDKINLLEYILNGNHKITIVNGDQVLDSYALSIPGTPRYNSSSITSSATNPNRMHPIFIGTIRELTMLHYNAYYGGKEVFRKSIHKLKEDIKEKNFSWELTITLETKEDKHNSSVSQMSILALAYEMGRRDIFDFIVDELPNELEIDSSKIKVDILTRNNIDMFVCNVRDGGYNPTENYKKNMLKLYMLIIGYRVEDFKQNELELSISKDKIKSFLEKVKRENIDSYLSFNNPLLKELFKINNDYRLTGEEKPLFRADLDRCIKFRQNDLDNLDPSNPSHIVNKILYIHSIPYTLNPIKATDILINFFENLGSSEEEILKLLNSYNRDKRIIHIAIEKDIYRLTKFLINKRIDIFAEDKAKKIITPLHLACKEGLSEILNLICSQIEDKNLEYKEYLRDSNNKLPLHYAIENGNKECVEVLVKYPGILGPLDGTDLTLLINFALDNDSDILRNKILSENLDYSDSDGNSILAIAVKKGTEANLEYILENYPHFLNITNKYEESPLHIAANYKRISFFNRLLKEGANPNIKDVDRYTPIFRLLYDLELSSLKECDRVEVCEILKDVNINILERHIDFGIFCCFKIYSRRPLNLLTSTHSRGFLDLLIDKKLYRELAALFSRDDIYELIRKYNKYWVLKSIIFSNSYNLVANILRVYRSKYDRDRLNLHARISLKDPPMLLAFKNRFCASFKALFDFGYPIKVINRPLGFLIYTSIEYYGDNDLEKKDSLVEYIIKRAKIETKKQNEEEDKKYIRSIRRGVLTCLRKYSFKDYVYQICLEKAPGEGIKTKDISIDAEKRGEDMTLEDYIKNKDTNPVVKKLKDEDII